MEATEIKNALDGIKSVIDSRIANIETKGRELSDEILMLKQGGIHMPMESKETATLGARVWSALQDNVDLLQKTDRLKLQIKAATDAVTTSSGRNIVSGGVGVPAGMPLGIQFGLPTRSIGGVTAVEYSRYSGLQGAAAVQATEGGAKAAVRPDHTLITQAGITIAGYAKMSKQAISDSAELQRAVDVVLRRSIAGVLDSVLVAGSGTWGGFATLGTAVTSLLYTSLADAASEAVANMQEDGFMPDVIAMTPADWLALQVKTNTGGDYLSGPYLGPLPELLRGMRVVLSPSVAAGKCHVIDSSQCELQIVDDMSVEIGTDGTDFTANLRTVLAEMRVIPTFRAAGAVQVVTPKAAI